jgi:prolyl oligopeptidase PreP (S9A serine peptidase family)
VKAVSNGEKFPSVFATTADHDDRVPSFNSFKYVATLQHVHGQEEEKPYLILKVSPNAGHSEGKPLSVHR